MEWPLFTVLLIKVLNKLLKFLLNMVPMFIFKINWFSFFLIFFYFLFFLSLFVVVGSLLVILCCPVVELCEIYFVFVLFLTAFFLLKNGMTALDLAASNGFEQIVKILIEHGANVHLQEQLVFFFFDFFYFICCCGFIIGCFVLSCGWVVWDIFCFVFF